VADRLGDRLFTFAVLTDSHLNAEEGISTSPYRANRLADARLRWAVAAVAARDPAFTVHLGDMGNPLPGLSGYAGAADRFREMVRPLSSPLHLVPGNHCVGDKPTGWVPVPRVSADSLAAFEKHYGPQFHSFDHGPCHFVAFNSLLFNSPLEAAREQQAWLERDLAEAEREGRRLWLLMHYPAFVVARDEPGSYDNLDEPGRSWLLDLIARHPIEAVLSGHVHSYFYNRFGGADLYTLPATSFVRHDYGELFSVAPQGLEGGRDDREKLGYGLVEVRERGHRVQVIRTRGATLAPGERFEPCPILEPAPASAERPVALEMRENWLRLQTLRPNNSISPFTRRRARNDWAVLALEEMGVRRIRLALRELEADDVRRRVTTLRKRGYEFQAYSYGRPGAAEHELVERDWDLLAGWELVLQLGEVDSVVAKLAALDLPCFLSELRDVDRSQVDDANVRHEANYGFQVHEPGKVEALCAAASVCKAFAGLVFRLRRRGEPRIAPWEGIREISRLGRESGLRHQAHIVFAGNLTAERLVDDLATANRVAEATLAAAAAGNVDLCLDTFEDVDRGYFVSHGLVDRRYNPRLAARVLRHLNAALARFGSGGIGESRLDELPAGRRLTLRRGSRLLIAALPSARLELSELGEQAPGQIDSVTLIDLDSGTLSEVAATTANGKLRLARPIKIDRPHLFVAG
jgi:3',5'-cyclic AMP phosphodiesterase CpdA